MVQNCAAGKGRAATARPWRGAVGNSKEAVWVAWDTVESASEEAMSSTGAAEEAGAADGGTAVEQQCGHNSGMGPAEEGEKAALTASAKGEEPGSVGGCVRKAGRMTSLTAAQVQEHCGKAMVRERARVWACSGHRSRVAKRA